MAAPCGVDGCGGCGGVDAPLTVPYWVDGGGFGGFPLAGPSGFPRDWYRSMSCSKLDVFQNDRRPMSKCGATSEGKRLYAMT